MTPALRRISTVFALLLATSAATFAPAPAVAQSGLEQVERLTRLGRTEEARDELVRWWDEDRGSASRRELQRGLWLRGRLTVDPVQAELDFRRLVVLYPSGQFTPDAIFRMAQGAWARGDVDAARGHVATLRRDYSRSEAARTAESWFEAAGPPPPAGDTPTPVTSPEAGPDTRGGPPADRPRGDRPPTPGADTPPPERDPPEDVPQDEPEAAGPPMNYYVQLGAFTEEERARALADEVGAEGVDVRVVRVEGSRFTHVRVGRFAERAAAVELLEELTEQGISAALVRDDRPERPIG